MWQEKNFDWKMAPVQELCHLPVGGGLGWDARVGGLQVYHCLAVLVYL